MSSIDFLRRCFYTIWIMKHHLELPKLTDRQFQIITGSLLGDGSLHGFNNHPNWNWRYSITQSKSDKDGIDKISYVSFLFNELSPYSSSIGSRTTQNRQLNFTLKKPEYYTYDLIIHAHPIWRILGNKWYARGSQGNLLRNKNNRIIKVVPQDLKLTPLTACIWFMDDGFNYSKDGNCSLETQGFSLDECNFLIERLTLDLGIKSKVRCDNRTKAPFIYIGVESWRDFIELIKPYVAWDCFKYKTDTNYNKLPHRGESHSCSKLTDSDVKKIFTLYESGHQQKQIAQVFDITASQIALILNGRRWKHLGLEPKEPSNYMKPHLTYNQISHILELSSQKLSQSVIAKLVGTNQSTISRVLKNTQAKLAFATC